MHTRITTLIAGAALAGAALAGAGPANADPAQDSQFLELLSQGGVQVTNQADVIKGAKEMCQGFTEGATRAEGIKDLVADGVSQKDATTIVDAAITVYCPQVSG